MRSRSIEIMPQRLVLVITILWLIVAATSNIISACDECLKFFSESEKIDKSINRLVGIVRVNEEFIASLDPSDTSEMIKATSNVNIAKKRITALNVDLKTKQSNLESQECKKCLTGDNKDG